MNDGSALIIYLFVNVGLSALVGIVADKKGRSFAAFFFLSLVFSFLVGILVILAMPQGEGGSAAVGRVECLFCKEQINARAVVCKHCGKDVDPQPEVATTITMAQRDRTRGARLIIGIILCLFGLVLVLPALFSFSAYSIAPILMGLIPLGFGVWNIVRSVKDARAAASAE
jgi:hypothetical protein